MNIAIISLLPVLTIFPGHSFCRLAIALHPLIQNGSNRTIYLTLVQVFYLHCFFLNLLKHVKRRVHTVKRLTFELHLFTCILNQ